MANPVLSAIALVAFCSSAPQPKEQFGTVEITIEPEFFGQTLVLGNRLYHTPKGDSLYLDLLRFYISSVQLQGTKGVYKEPNSYHLIDIEENDSPKILLKNVPLGQYTQLRFLIGTDSLTNVAGAMGGDLDPTKGMYWAWNTGYINAKIEGRSASCNTRRQAFEFHIGGYKSPHQTVREVVLPLKNIVLRENSPAKIPVQLNLGTFFSHIQLALTNSIMIPSAQAALLADYFQETFSTE